MKIMNESVPKIAKVIYKIMILFFLLIILFIIFGSLIVSYIWNKNMDETIENTLNSSTAISASLNGDLIKNIKAVPNDAGTPEYESIKSKLVEIRNAYDNVRFAYIFKQKGGKIYFVADSEPASSEDYSPPGQEYTEASYEDKKPFEDGKIIITKPATDRWGTWVSVLVPMKDVQTGEIIAVFGMDYEVAVWHAKALSSTVQAGIAFFALLFLLIALYVILNKNEKIMESQNFYKKSEENYRLLVTRMSQGLAVHDVIFDESGKAVDYIFIDANESYEIITGLKRENIIGKTVLEVLPETEGYWIEKYGNVAKTGDPIHYEDYSKELGKYFEITAYSPKSSQFAVIITDVTDRKAIEENLIIKEKMLQAIAISTQELLTNRNYKAAIKKGLVLLGEATGVDRAQLFKNNYMEEDSAFTTSQILNWDSGLVKTKIDNPHLRDIPFDRIDEFINSLSKGQPFSCIIKNLKCENTKNVLSAQGIVSIILLPIFVENTFWGFLGFDECKRERVWTDIEISLLQTFASSISRAIERKIDEDEILYMGNHNALTGLYNRRKFEEFLGKLETSDQLPITIIMGDINGIKIINDKFGHLEGDNILKKIAVIMKEECGEKAIVSRHGGDEFVAILLGVTDSEATVVIQKIKARCLKEIKDEIPFSISFGIKTKIQKEETLKDCLQIAEERMYASKLLESQSIRNVIISNFRDVMEDQTGETRLHCERMTEMARLVGEEMGMPTYAIENLMLLTLLHDIGKTGVPDNILFKPSKLDHNERAIMEKHCEIGYRIANSMPELAGIADGILNHQEKWDGTGYPNGVKGQDIPITSRIVAVLDTYDAMTNDRPYRKALSETQAVNELLRCKGTQFDPDVVDLFIKKVLKKDI